MISSTGVVVYEHHCSHSETFKGFYSEVDHDCNKKKAVDHCKIEKASCCKSIEIPENIPVAEEECCTTDISIYQIDSDYTKTSSSSFDEQLFVSFDTEFFNRRDVLFIVDKTVRGPPDLSYKPSTKRSLLQVYII